MTITPRRQRLATTGSRTSARPAGGQRRRAGPCLAIVAMLAACSASPAATTHVESDAGHPSGAASDAPASASAPEDPLAACEGVEVEGDPVEIMVGTASYAYEPRMLEGPRHCQPFVIVFTNSDPPVGPDSPAGTNKHDVTIRAENLIGPLLFQGEAIGQTTIRYEVPGLPAGEHYMYCSLHPPMTGSVVVGA